MKDIKAIFILAWHSKYNPWATKDWLIERDLVKNIAYQLSLKLDDIEDFTTYIIWIEDLSLNGKVDIVNIICKNNWYNVENSILIEIHTNAWWGTWVEALGYSEYKQFIELSNNILDETRKTTWLRNRWIKKWEHLYIVKNTIPLACLFECGFIDTKKDIWVLRNDLNSFSDGIYNWLKKYIWFNEVSELDKLIKENRELKKDNWELEDILERINILSS